MGDTKRTDEFKLAPAILDALKTRAELKQAGAAADGDQVLDDAVRKHWPVTREWHYLCDRCDDTGWQRHECTLAHRCGRRFCEGTPVTHRHEYVSPCTCAKGQQMQPKPKATHDPGDATTPRARPWKKLFP